MIPIQAITIPTQGTAIGFNLKCFDLDMTATTATFYYELVGASDFNTPQRVFTSGNISMTEIEYSNWGADNNYCIQWAAQKLGLTLI